MAKAKITIVDVEQFHPVCPHCEKPLSTIWRIGRGWFFERTAIYVCPLCRRILSIGYTWLG